MTTTRLLTGDRPTGPLHLGHLLGTLQERVALQDSHDCWFIVADLHTLTTRPERESIAGLRVSIRDVVLDSLSVGIDPSKSTIYLQSGVPAVYDLAILLGMLIPARPLWELESLKDMARTSGRNMDQISLGLLGYPVLQAADILMAKAELIPVGEDNAAHIEVARQAAAAFNERYGQVFPLPKSHLSRVTQLPGIDGRKMSKSAGNAIYLKDASTTIREKVGSMPIATLGTFLAAFLREGGEEDAARLASGELSHSAAIEKLCAQLESVLAPIRAARAQLEADPGYVEEILVDGTLKAREVANKTLQSVREHMGLESLWSSLVEVTSTRAQERKRPRYDAP